MSEIHALQVEHLTVSYEKNAVLWDLNFTVPSGKLVGIIGPNGAGKSTFLKSCLDLVKPVSGKIAFFDKPFKECKKQIAYVPQRSSVDWDFPITVFEVVLMGRYNRLSFFKRARSSDKQAALEALNMVGMASFADRQISQLSGGQQQRVFIARALLQDAEIYLMDEPFAGVDVKTEKELISLMQNLQKKGKTLFIVHHDLASVENYFNWVILLNTCLVASGPVKEIFHPQNIMRCYGRSPAVLDEAAKIAENAAKGIYK